MNINKYLTTAKENIRFTLAIIANVIAIMVSVWWLIDSNSGNNNSIEIEPIVTTLALLATLLGLNFVNNKFTQPYLKVKSSMSIASNPLTDNVCGISITVENHSMIKAFISSFKLEIPEKKQAAQFLYEGFTGLPLPKVILEPGQSFSFNIVKENFGKSLEIVEQFGDFVVTTDIGHKFKIPANEIKKSIKALNEA